MMNITYDLPDLGRKDHVDEGIAVFIALMAETSRDIIHELLELPHDQRFQPCILPTNEETEGLHSTWPPQQPGTKSISKVMATSPSSMDVWLQDACKQHQQQTPDSKARLPTNWSLPSSSCQKFALLCTYTAKPRSASIEDRCVQTTQMPRLTLAPIKIMDVKDVHALTRIHRSCCFSRSIEALLRRDDDLNPSFFKANVRTEHSGGVASIAAWSTRKERKANAADDENVLRTETREKKKLW